MPRTCSVCVHEQRDAIDQALVNGEASTAVAARYFTVSGQPLGRMAVQRHKDEHLPLRLVKAAEQEDVRAALDIVTQLKTINGASLQVLADARSANDGELALKAVDRVLRQIELQAKLLGELDDRPQVNLVLAPQWPRLVQGLRDVLAPHPAILAQVAAHLLTLEEGQVSGAR